MTIETIITDEPTDKPTSFKNIYQRILGIMSDVSYIQKGDKTVANQYRYVSHDQVTAKIHPLLVKHGVLCIPTVKSLTQEGNRTHVELIICFVNVDNPSDQFAVTYHGYGVDAGDKGPGKAISYAFKVAILKVLALETGEDPDHDQNAVYEPAKCQEFDSINPPDGDNKRFDEFIAYCADASGKHIEDIKREALGKMDSFLAAYMKWKPKKQTKGKINEILPNSGMVSPVISD